MFAVLGAGAGLAMGLGLMAGVGLLRGGFRYIDEFDGDRDALLLGVVPDLGARREPTPEAALCIHHARALIERRVPMLKDRGRIIGVTSPTAGDGKTTVCCSLATSFAEELLQYSWPHCGKIGRYVSHRARSLTGPTNV